jgi:hypothetical protein
MSPVRLRSCLNWTAIIILLVGLTASLLVLRVENRAEREMEAAEAANPGAPLPGLDSRKHVRDVEIYYGKLGVLMEEADELLRGKPLPKMLAIGSLLAASLLFVLAARLRE